MPSCRICGTKLTPFLDLGRMPLADAFLRPEDFPGEYFFKLEAALCEACGMVQLTEDVDRSAMFHGEYAFFSSTSARMVEHFRTFARRTVERVQKDAPFVVEVGCNDGSLLGELAERGIRHLGVDPAQNVVDVARRRGLAVECGFFEEDMAGRILGTHGKADLILSANCMCHIPYMGSVLLGVRQLLGDDGLFVFEDPYLADIVERGAFDQFYDEHALYFSVRSVAAMLAPHDLELVDVEPQPVHGGSMRYFVAKSGEHPVSPSVAHALVREERLALHRQETYEPFRRRASRVRQELPSLLASLKAAGKSVAGYAATAKSATVLNYCGITTDLLPYIYDTTPAKQGKYTPGSHIPVRPYAELVPPYPDYALLFAWNHSAEILQKEQEFLAGGGRFIVYVPEVGVLGA